MGSAWFWALAILMASASVVAQDATDADKIRALRGQSNDAIARHDVPAILSFIDEEFQVTAGSGALIKSGAEMGTVLEGLFQEFGDMKFVRTIESVEISKSDPLAAEIGTWVGTWTTPEGKVKTGGRYAASWRKGKSGWRIRTELFVTLYCDGPACGDRE